MQYQEDDKDVAAQFEPEGVVPGSPPEPRIRGGFTPRGPEVAATAGQKAQEAMVGSAVSVMKSKAALWGIITIYAIVAGVLGIVPFIVVMWRLGQHALAWHP